MIEKCKVQIGDMLLDAEIDVEWKRPEYDSSPNDPIKHMRAFMAQFPPWNTEYGRSPLEDMQAYAAKYPTWDKVVEGSVVHPVDDPARLLEGGKE